MRSLSLPGVLSFLFGRLGLATTLSLGLLSACGGENQGDPSGASTGGGDAGTSTGASASGGQAGDKPGGSDAASVSACGSSVARDTTPFGCNFAFGTHGNTGERASYLDFISTWVGYEYFNGNKEACDGCTVASSLANSTASAAYYAYFIGYSLPDCNTHPAAPNKCTDGAAWVRDNRQLILDWYSAYAEKTYAASPGKPVIWLLEGDFVQNTYAEQTSPLSYAELGQLASDIVCAIKSKEPNALVGLNHSTWLSDEAAQAYWKAMPTALLDFVWTTGVGNNAGYLNAGASSSSYNAKTARYDALYQMSGLGILVDTSFGASQQPDTWTALSNADFNARVAEGVVALNATETPPSDYQSRVAALRSSLQQPVVCAP